MTEALRANSLRVWQSGLESVSPQLAYAIRFAVCACAAIGIGHLPGLVTNQSSWILITVLMVSQPDSAGALQKGLLRSFGTITAAFASIVLFGQFSQNPPLLMAGLFAVQAVGAYGFSGPRYQYAWFVFAFTTSIVLGDAIANVGDVETIAFQRAGMVGLGILIVVVTDMLLAPTQTDSGLRKDLASRARSLGSALRTAIVATKAPSTNGSTVAGTPLSGQLGQIAAARLQIGVSATRSELLRRVAIILEALASRVRVFGHLAGDRGSETHARKTLVRAVEALATQVRDALEAVATGLETESVPVPFANGIDSALVAVAFESARLQERADSNGSAAEALSGLRDMAALLEMLEKTLAEPAGPSTKWKSLRVLIRAGARFRLDPFRVQIGLRTGIAVCAVFVVSMSLGWGNNALIGPITFMIAAIPTRGNVAKTVTLFAAVVLFGTALADFAIVFVSPMLNRLPLAFLHIAAVTSVLGYATATRPQLGVLRTIGGLLALLSVYGVTGAPTDVYGPYSTACFAALGLIVGGTATYLFWPATAANLFRQRAAALLETLSIAVTNSGKETDESEQIRRKSKLVRDYDAQVSELTSLHGQAAHDPIDSGLDDSRRTALLTLMQNLFDATLSVRPATRLKTAPEARAFKADTREDNLPGENLAVSSTLRFAADALRNGGITRSEVPEHSGKSETEFSHRALATCRVGLESWLADWATCNEPIPPTSG